MIETIALRSVRGAINLYCLKRRVPGMVMAFYAADLIFSTDPGLGTVVIAVFALAVIGAMVAAIHGLALLWLVRRL